MEWDASGNLIVPTYEDPATQTVQLDNQGNLTATNQLLDQSGNVVAQESMEGQVDKSGNITVTDTLTDNYGNVIAQEHITGQIDNSGSVAVTSNELVDGSGVQMSQDKLVAEMGDMRVSNVDNGGNHQYVDPITGLTIDGATGTVATTAVESQQDTFNNTSNSAITSSQQFLNDESQQTTLNNISNSAITSSQQFVNNEVNSAERGAALMSAAEFGGTVYEDDGTGNEKIVADYS